MSTATLLVGDVFERLAELPKVRRGLAVDTGMKRLSSRGVPVTVFAATAKGREVARG